MEGKKSKGKALMLVSDNEKKVVCKSRKLPPIDDKTQINYSNLLLFSKEIEEREKVSREDAHEAFMSKYHLIFEHKKLSNDFTRLAEIPLRSPKDLADNEKNKSHNITEHLSKLHRHHVSPTRQARTEELIKKIRKYSRKPPFERTAKENHHLVKCLLFVDCFSYMPEKILEKLVATAHLEKWDPNFTVFGDSGFYLIVKGTCLPNETSTVDRSQLARVDSFFSVDDSSENLTTRTLQSGDYFGRLENSKDADDDRFGIMSVVTIDTCEMLRFSNTSFQRVTKQIRDEEYGDKLQLAQRCKLFQDWPNLSLRRISEIFHWAEVAPGETLAKEGSVATRICFIKHGVCQLKKVLSVASVNQDGRKIKRRKEVVTGNLEPGDSFGEKSLVANEPFEQSVVSQTPLLIAVIDVEDLKGLEEVTLALFRQTCETVGSRTSEANIKKKYIDKQAELDWKTKKEAIVKDVLYYNGIMPGYSKWSRNPTEEDVKHLTSTKYRMLSK